MPNADRDERALTQLRVVKSCPANWNDMSGTSQARFSNRCSRRVYNISEMDRQAALDLIESTEGRLCVRYYVRPDGKIMTADCPNAIRRRVKLLALFAPVLTLFGYTAAFPVMGESKEASHDYLVRNLPANIARIEEELKTEKPGEDRDALLERKARMQRELADLTLPRRQSPP